MVGTATREAGVAGLGLELERELEIRITFERAGFFRIEENGRVHLRICFVEFEGEEGDDDDDDDDVENMCFGAIVAISRYAEKQSRVCRKEFNIFICNPGFQFGIQSFIVYCPHWPHPFDSQEWFIIG